ncbi:universal stress protein [Polyangium jinanense]|uniref:Universal stress protein n=1 Tax=Polyangium jinanense TaxID=2829994 RepID=A0A9X4AQ70_9BACT|nr:universal stress protein [Polyangium jinanense]MDC3954480.1 universal stress protein [Polyangium jinanense]MDC3980783.1 universal stress protein [Polyangium jinanense]
MALGDVVLVATDLSESADEAIKLGHEHAQRAGGKLVVCHVVHEVLRSAPLFPQAIQADMEAVIHAESHAAAAVEDRVKDLTGRPSNGFEVRIESGGADASILRVAEDVGATLVVTGSRGLTGIARLLLGNVAERIVRYAHCPVLVARPHKRTNKILATTDLSELSQPGVALAGQVAAEQRGALTVLHALDILPSPAFGFTVPFGGAPVIPPPELIEQMRGAADGVLVGMTERLGIKAERRVIEGDAATVVIRTAEELDAELVVVATHGRTGLARVALGSVAEKIVRGAHCSVLVARSH